MVGLVNVKINLIRRRMQTDLRLVLFFKTFFEKNVNLDFFQMNTDQVPLFSSNNHL